MFRRQKLYSRLMKTIVAVALLMKRDRNVPGPFRLIDIIRDPRGGPDARQFGTILADESNGKEYFLSGSIYHKHWLMGEYGVQELRDLTPEEYKAREKSFIRCRRDPNVDEWEETKKRFLGPAPLDVTTAICDDYHMSLAERHGALRLSTLRLG